MQLIFKGVIYLFLFFLSIQNTFSQDKPIIAKFNQDGVFYKNLEDFSQPLAHFKEDEDCIVISYLGNYTYKIKYKELEGFVKDEYLIINEKMMDLFFAHEKKQRNKAIEIRELRQKKKQIVNSRQDSISKIKAQEKKQLEAIQKAKLEQQRIEESRRLDSIANIKAKEKKRLEAIQKARLEQQRIEDNRRLDSIANIKAQEKRRLEAIQKAKLEQQRIDESRRLDSIANVKSKDEDTSSSKKIKSWNTCNYLINEYDSFYKQQVIITDKYTINENLSIELIREGNTSKIHINTRVDLGCASYVPNTRSSVSISLENDQVITLYHSGSLDCNYFSLKAILSETKINQLNNSPIKSLTFRGTKRSYTISDIDYKEFFIDKLKCIE